MVKPLLFLIQYILWKKRFTFWEISIDINFISLTRHDEKSYFWPWKWGVDLYTRSNYRRVNMVHGYVKSIQQGRSYSVAEQAQDQLPNLWKPIVMHMDAMANGRTIGGHIKTINTLAFLYNGLVIYLLMSYPSGCYKNMNNSSTGKFTRNALIGSLNLDLNSTWWMLWTRRRIVWTGFGFSRVNYYANSTASFQHAKLLLSGDVAVNPGPEKCQICDRTMVRNHPVMICTECKRRTHIRCSRVSPKEYAQLQQKPSYTWYCTNCLFSFLPGYDDKASTEHVNIIDINLDLQVLRHDIIDYHKDNHHDLMIAHLNINSVQNKLDHLKLLHRELKSRVIFLPETKIDSSYKDDQFFYERI